MDAQKVFVGERIKAVREANGVTLQELAEKSGYSAALLNQVENHLDSPPLGALAKIASALGVPISELWGERDTEPYSLVKKDEGREVSRFASKEGISYGYEYRSLGFGKKNRHIEPYIVTLEPPTVKPPAPSTHPGEEFIFVVSGEVEVYLDGHTDLLQPGDSIQYDATVPHRVRSHGKNRAEILAVIWSPEE